MKQFATLILCMISILPTSAFGFEITKEGGATSISAKGNADALGMGNLTIQNLTLKKQSGQVLTQAEQSQWNELEADRATFAKNEKAIRPVCRMPVMDGDYKGASLSTSSMPSCKELTKKQLKDAPFIEEQAESAIRISIQGEKPKFRYSAPANERALREKENLVIQKKWAEKQ